MQATLLRGLRTAELTVFGESSHMPHWEERDRYMTVVGSWRAIRTELREL